MAQRIWFTPANTSGLTADDLVVLNRAVRIMHRPGSEPSHRSLAEYRFVYRPGMSASAVADAVEALHDA